MKGKPLALIYFIPKDQEIAKDVAARVRNDGGDARLVWGHKFTEPEDMDREASAVIIQRDLTNSSLIAETYAAFSAGVEIHFIDNEGVFISEEGDPVEAEQATVEPAAAQPAQEAGDASVPAPEAENVAADGDGATSSAEPVA